MDTNTDEKELNFEKQLWDAADKLRGSLDASGYKHIVLGLIFLRYISESFENRRNFLKSAVNDPSNKEYYTANEKTRNYLLESKDEYLKENVFYVPPQARWSYIHANASSPQIAKIIDDAMDLIEKENPNQLKGVLPKIYAQTNIDYRTLGEIVNLINNIYLGPESDRDILGRIYEYFLGQFASAEGKRGGEFYTPRCLVRLIVEILEPYENCRVFDPACGSGGMFVQSHQFLKIHKKDPAKISFYGQEKNHTTWRLCKMNLAIRGINANIALGDSYHEDKFPDLRFDFVITNPPFNVSDWGPDRIKPNDPRVKYGLAPRGNANFMWIEHFIYHLSPNGMAGFVMANGALAVGGKEGEIRKKIIEDDLIDVIIACPPKLFYNVSLPVSLWFVTKNKNNGRFRNRSGEILFIDAREIYTQVSRKQSIFTDEQIKLIADTVRKWRGQKEYGEYKDIPGFCKLATLDEVRKNGYVLTPGRYVGLKPEEDDGVPFEKKMRKLSEELKGYFAVSEKLEMEIMEILKKF
jgi:type I restriction enzyme M protein